MHIAVLDAHSEFFKAALKQDWAEGQQRTVNLPDDDAIALNTYFHWLYTHMILNKMTEEG